MISVDDQQMDWQQGMTLTKLLAALGQCQHIAVVRLDGKLVSRPNFTHTHIPDKAVIHLISLVAGG